MSEKKKYYAIKVGKDVTDKIVDNWEECEKLVKGYPSVYKSFKNKKEAKSYIKNTTDEQVEYQLKWNEIHRLNRLKEKLEIKMGFKIPMYIVEAIIKTQYDKSNVFSLIDISVSNNRLSKKDAQKLRKYIEIC